MVFAGDVVLIVEEAAGKRRDAEEREEIAGGEYAMHLCRVSIEHKRDGTWVDGGVGGNLAEAGLLFAPIEVVEVGGFVAALHLRVGFGDGDDAALILEGKGFEEQAVDATEDSGRGSDAESEGENDRDGESGRLAQLAGGIAEVAQQGWHRFS